VAQKLAIVVRTDLGMGRGKIGAGLAAWLREGQPSEMTSIGALLVQ